MTNQRILTAIPVYNEAAHVRGVLSAVRKVVYPDIGPILTIDDGSTDGTAGILAAETDLLQVKHDRNRGYGAAVATAFQFALDHGYDTLVTMDCDGQHEPGRIPVLLEALHGVDIVSGSRYLRDFRQDTPAPSDRSSINATITKELNAAFGFGITDAFCGFKAYRVAALRGLKITESGWGMPLQVWVQAAVHGLRIREIGVPRLYLDPNRAFGGAMNDPTQRLAYYRQVIRSASSVSSLVAAGCPEYCPELL